MPNFFSKQPLVTDGLLIRRHQVNYDGSEYIGPLDPRQQVVSQYVSSVTTPNFKNLSRKNLPLHPFQVQRELWSSGRMGVRQGPNGLGQFLFYEGRPDWVGVNPISYFLPLYNRTNALADLLQSKMLTRLGNQKINIAQAFAERKQTANMLIKSVNRLVTFAVLFRAGKFSSARKILEGRRQLFTGKPFPKDLVARPNDKLFANLWLEYTYGWRPLVSDIYGGAELLAQSVMRESPTEVAVTSKTYETNVFRTASASFETETVQKYNVKCKFAIQYDISDYDKNLLSRTGLSNPALLAWELLPYSFVVDWVYPVGTYLRNLVATDGLTFKSGWSTRFATLKSDQVPIRAFPPYYLAEPGYWFSESAYARRDVFTSFPTNKPPRLDWQLGISQVLSGLALLDQIFHRIR